MSKITLQVDVQKEVNDVVVLVCDLVLAIKNKKAISEIVASELVKLEQAIAGLSSLGADFQMDPAGAAKAIELPMTDLIVGLLQPAPAAPAAPQA